MPGNSDKMVLALRAAITVFLIVQSSIASARAQNQGEARALYDAGKFMDCAAMAQSPGTSQGLSLAARCTLAHYAYVDRAAATAEIFRQATALAHRALELDARNAEAHLQAAVALGYRGRMSGPMPAHFAGYAKDARAHIQAAQALEPDNPWAYALLGAWNMEIVRKGGQFMARTLYGARLHKGLELYHRALELAPRNPVLHYEFGLALAAQDAGKFSGDAAEHLGIALTLTPKNAFERLAQGRAQMMLDALEAGDKRTLRRAIVAQTEFPRAAQNTGQAGGARP